MKNPNAVPARIIGYRNFTDGTRRPIYQDRRGQYILDNDGKPKYGIWLFDRKAPDEDYDTPIFVKEDDGDESA